MPRVLPPGTFCGQPAAGVLGTPGGGRGLANYAGMDGQSGLDLPQFRVLRKSAAQLINNAGPLTAVGVLFYAHNPSPRLRWSISVGFELDPAANLVTFTAGTGPTWQMRAIRLPESGGSPADLNDIFVNGAGTPTPRALPDAYEIDSAVKDIRGTLALFSGAGGTIDSGQFGNLVIEARWEPHDGFVNRAEIAQLLAQVNLYLIGNAPTLNNGT
jgi:hypothetical protein